MGCGGSKAADAPPSGPPQLAKELANAAWKGDLGNVRSLLDRGAPPNTEAFNGFSNGNHSALNGASRNGHAAIVSLLLEQPVKPDIESRCQGPWEVTPLQQAGYHGRAEVAKILLRHGASITSRSGPGCGNKTAKEIAQDMRNAQWRELVAAIEAQAGGGGGGGGESNGVQLCDTGSRVTWAMAEEYAHSRGLEMVTIAEAQRYIRENRIDMTPLDVWVPVLKDRKTKGPERRDWIQLSSMTQYGAGRLGRTHCDYHKSYPSGWGDNQDQRVNPTSVFHHVFLIVGEAATATANPALNSELNNVARNTDDTAKARSLVDAGADLSSTNGGPWRHTPLHQAAFHGRYEMAKTLVELGAPLDLHSNPCGRGSTGIPLELARGGGHHKIAEMLEAAMAGKQPGGGGAPATGPLHVHEARYGWAGDMWGAALGSGRNHGGGAKDVTDIVRRMIVNDELHINPNSEAQYMNRTFWVETSGGPAIPRKLGVRYAYGEGAAITAETPAVPNETVSLHVTRSEGGKEGGGGGGGNDLSGTYYSVERSNGTPNGDRYEFRLEGDHYYIIRPPGGQKKEDDYFTFDGTTGYHCKGPKNTLLRNGDLHWDLDGGKWVSRPQEGGGGAHAKGAVTLSGFSGYNSRLNGEYNPDGDSVSGKPVYTHMHHEGVGAGHNWCRMWYAHGAWRIGHVSWVHGDNALAVAFVKSGAALPGQIEPSANWMEHKGHGAGHDYGKDERHFTSAGKVVISGGAQAGGDGGDTDSEAIFFIDDWVTGVYYNGKDLTAQANKGQCSPTHLRFKYVPNAVLCIKGWDNQSGGAAGLFLHAKTPAGEYVLRPGDKQCTVYAAGDDKPPSGWEQNNFHNGKWQAPAQNAVWSGWHQHLPGPMRAKGVGGGDGVWNGKKKYNFFRIRLDGGNVKGGGTISSDGGGGGSGDISLDAVAKDPAAFVLILSGHHDHPDCNGRYNFDGHENGKPKYAKVTGGNPRLFWTGSSWDCFWGGYSPESGKGTPVPPLDGYDRDRGSTDIRVKYERITDSGSGAKTTEALGDVVHTRPGERFTWQMSKDYAAEMGGQLLTLEEARAFLAGQPLYSGDDQWCAVGADGNRDWVQVGSRHHHPGKSHNIDCHQYPPWGDDANNQTYGTPSWNYVVLYKKLGEKNKAPMRWEPTMGEALLGWFSGSDEGRAAVTPSASTNPVVMGTIITDESLPVMPSTVVFEQTSAQPPLLIEMVNAIKKELGIDGTLAQVVAKACEELGVDTKGKALNQQATECWVILGGGQRLA